MNQEITSEHRARIFSLYIGQRLCVIDKAKESWYDFSQGEGALRLVGVVHGAVYVSRIAETIQDRFAQCTLLLRKFEKISDEERMCVIQAYWPSILELSTDVKIHKPIREGGTFKYTAFSANGQIATNEISLFGLNPEASQYLTSIGVAIPIFFDKGHPMNGRTPIEAGLAIESHL